MNFLPLHRTMVRAIGLMIALVACVPTFIYAWDIRHHRGVLLLITIWLSLFIVFGILYWITSVAPGDLESRQPGVWRRQIVSIATQVIIVLTMVSLVPCYSSPILLVLVAWQVALLLPLRAALLWILIQASLLAAILYLRFPYELTMFATNTSFGFQLFAFAAAAVARSESRARCELARTNAELRATQELLSESSRIGERARISAELHDVLGHNLTALNIHLEVAKHVAEGKALEHVEKSQALAKLILRDVREVVSAVRDESQIDVRRAVETLVEGLPYPHIHLKLAENLRVDDSAHAHTLLRCVQEIVTNALRHSGAENLWLEIQRANDGLEVSARDDGRGAKAMVPGNGLMGMRQRLEQSGGRLQFDTQPEAGFTINAWLPLNGTI